MGFFRRKQKGTTPNEDMSASTVPSSSTTATTATNTNTTTTNITTTTTNTTMNAYDPLSFPKGQDVELGTIHYANLTPDGKHGDMDVALCLARETSKPIFCNFVEWSG